MDWLVSLFTESSVAHAVIVLALVVSLGLALGSIRLFGVSLGVGGVLFSGLIVSHFGLTLDHELMHFVREFGLILFVYAIGLQVGPGFFASFRKQGLKLNLLAMGIVLGGALIAVFIGLVTGIDFQVVVGLLCGGVTNTPSLGAAQEALKGAAQATADGADLVGLGYAVAYPFGILGIIITMLLIRKIFRIDTVREAAEFERAQHSHIKPLVAEVFELTNQNLAGKTIADLGAILGVNVVVSRIYRSGKQLLATAQASLTVGDVMRAVGTSEALEKFEVLVGRRTRDGEPTRGQQLTSKRLIVTKRKIAGKTLDELELPDRYGVVATRVIRSGVEFTPTREFRVQFGDRLRVVGAEEAVEGVSKLLGDSIRALNKPQIIPIFVGIGLGIIVGSIPIAIPHMPAPVKLGLAGGPLIVAILMGRIGKIGPLISYMPNPAKELLKEFGIALFLACVGLKSGERFFEIIVNGDGLYWMGLATMITFVPLCATGLLARAVFKLNYTSILGLLSGSMTDPPALAYATQLAGNDAPSVSYATVYPLTMLMRVVIAQVIVLVTLG